MAQRTKYPIYIPSKGRWDYSLTARLLEEMDADYHVVVEPPDEKKYAAVLGKKRLLVLPFHDLGQGSIPARNWIWEHALSRGAERHWCLDDNVTAFYRTNMNRRIRSRSAGIFRAVEAFSDRYENVALSGFHDLGFANALSPSMPPFRLNTRIYSMILLNSGINYRWRGKYNEDTDLSLRVLKDGWVTVLFNAFLGNKAETMKMPGGNTDTVYATGDHRMEFAKSLERQHPDVVKVTWKFKRWHHQVNYKPFQKNRLRLKPGVTPTAAPCEFGMRLARFNLETGEEVRS